MLTSKLFQILLMSLSVSLVFSGAALAQPQVGVKVTYDFILEAPGQTRALTQIVEVVSVDVQKKTFVKKTSVLEGEKVLKSMLQGDSFKNYQLPMFFGLKCATQLSGKEVSGVKYSYEKVNTGDGDYMACHLSYTENENYYDEYLADDVPFNSVKMVVSDVIQNTTRTFTLKSITHP